MCRKLVVLDGYDQVLANPQLLSRSSRPFPKHAADPLSLANKLDYIDQRLSVAEAELDAPCLLWR